MARFLFFSTVLILYVALLFLVRFLIRRSNRKIWHWNWLDRIGRLIPYFALLSIGFIMAATSLRTGNIFHFLTISLAALVIIFNLALLISLPLTLFFHFTIQYVRNHLPLFQRSRNKSVDERRRQLLKAATTLLPLFFLGTASCGFAGSFGRVKIRPLNIRLASGSRFKALSGLRILHLSDLHLGHYFNIEDLRRLCYSLSQFEFDLVVITGDLADDLDQLPSALELIQKLPSFYPKFFSLGNHEYFRDLNRILGIVDRSQIQLLRNGAVKLERATQSFYLVGIDDPLFMHRNIETRLSHFIDQAMADVPRQAPAILLSHRPQAIIPASKKGIPLVLSGHTHGGQIGINGRSIFEGVNDQAYLWGEYRRLHTVLYTSSGVGHWFPFRLGCPAEAPIIKLMI